MSKPIAFHIVARTSYGNWPFVTLKACQVMWESLQRAFPVCYAAIRMPNHFHIVVPADASPRALHWQTGVVLRTVSRTLGPKVVRWQTAPRPAPLADVDKTVTAIRYVHLNPVRAGYTADPLTWQWSTLREYLGATLAPPWLNRVEAARLHSVPLPQLSRSIWKLTSTDRHCSDKAKEPLRPWNPDLRFSASHIQRAMLIATYRQSVAISHRPLLAHACRELGGLNVVQTARELGLSRRGVQVLLARRPAAQLAPLLEILRRVLSDPRLTDSDPIFAQD